MYSFLNLQMMWNNLHTGEYFELTEIVFNDSGANKTKTLHLHLLKLYIKKELKDLSQKLYWKLKHT